MTVTNATAVYVIMMLVFGVIGYVMKKCNYPLAPMVLAIVLAYAALQGLAAAGQAGLTRYLQILEAEILSCMGLLGVQSLNALNRSHLCAAPVVTDPRALSSFPLLSMEENSFY